MKMMNKWGKRQNQSDELLETIDKLEKSDEPKRIWVVSSNSKYLDISMNELAFKLAKRYKIKVHAGFRTIKKIEDEDGAFTIESKFIDLDNMQNTEGYSMFNRQHLEHFVKDMDMQQVYPLELKDHKIQSVFDFENLLEGGNDVRDMNDYDGS